jgi:hypothetical protein
MAKQSINPINSSPISGDETAPLATQASVQALNQQLSLLKQQVQNLPAAEVDLSSLATKDSVANVTTTVGQINTTVGQINTTVGDLNTTISNIQTIVDALPETNSIATIDATSGTLNYEIMPELPDSKIPVFNAYVKAAISTTDISNLIKSIVGTTTVTPATPVMLQMMATGNSLVFGAETSNPPTTGVSGQTYSLLDHDKFGWSPDYVEAVSGQTTSNMLSREATYLLGKIRRDLYTGAVITVGGGPNDAMRYNGGSPENIKPNLIQIIANIRAYEAQYNFPITVVLESMTRNGKEYGGTSLADYETFRVAHNAEMLTGYKTIYGADYYVNYNAVSQLADVNNTTYFAADKQHFTDAGQLLRAQAIAPYFIAAYAGISLAPQPDPVASGNTGGGTGGNTGGGTGGGTTTPPASTSIKRRYKATSGVALTGSSLNWTDSLGSGDVLTTNTVAGISIVPNAINNKAAVTLNTTQLNGVIPCGITDATPFMIFAVIRLSDGNLDANYNILGLGLTQPADNSDPIYAGTMVDMLVFNGKICVHTNGSGVGNGENSSANPPAATIGQFAIYGVWSDGTYEYSYSSITGTSTAKTLIRKNMPDTPLRVGGGHFEIGNGDFNNGVADYADIIVENSFSQAGLDAYIAQLKSDYNLS